jgi:hypothetical protein
VQHVWVQLPGGNTVNSTRNNAQSTATVQVWNATVSPTGTGNVVTTVFANVTNTPTGAAQRNHTITVQAQQSQIIGTPTMTWISPTQVEIRVVTNQQTNQVMAQVSGWGTTVHISQQTTTTANQREWRQVIAVPDMNTHGHPTVTIRSFNTAGNAWANFNDSRSISTLGGAGTGTGTGFVTAPTASWSNNWVTFNVQTQTHVARIDVVNSAGTIVAQRFSQSAQHLSDRLSWSFQEFISGSVQGTWYNFILRDVNGNEIGRQSTTGTGTGAQGQVTEVRHNNVATTAITAGENGVVTLEIFTSASIWNGHLVVTAVGSGSEVQAGPINSAHTHWQVSGWQVPHGTHQLAFRVVDGNGNTLFTLPTHHVTITR